MSAGGQEQLIGVSAVVTAAVITGAELEKTGALPTTDRWIGFALAFFILGTLADFGVSFAGGLALLLAVATALARGDDALRLADRRRRARLRNRRSSTPPGGPRSVPDPLSAQPAPS